MSLPALQGFLDRFRTEYDQHRPHRSLPHRAIPGAFYHAMPKALPGPSRDPDTHDRVPHDRIGSIVTLRVVGALRHIGIGRTHAGTDVILLIQDGQVRVVNAVTEELLHELTIDPTRDHRPRAWQKARTHIRGFGPCRCPETSRAERPRHKDLRVFTDI